MYKLILIDMNITHDYLIELMRYKQANNVSLPDVAKYANIGINKLRRLLHSSDIVIPNKRRTLTQSHKNNISKASKVSEHNVRLKYEWEDEYNRFVKENQMDNTIGINKYSSMRGFNPMYLREYIRKNDLYQPRGIPMRTRKWKENISKSTLGRPSKGSAGKLRGRKLTNQHKERISAGLVRNHHDCSYSEWKQSKTERDLYYFEVKKHTESQDIHTLENIEKRGNAGIPGAYHLDHKFPIAMGFELGIDAESIGDISNLQMLPWLDNILKGNNRG